MMKEIGYIVLIVYVVMMLWLLIGALAQLQLMWYARKQKTRKPLSLPEQLPFVSIQLPVYNEQHVIAELFDSLAGLDYPKNLFEIQVLDDSNDETSFVIDRKVAELSALGFNISVVRRTNREGYKAGALQYGLPFCKGELIAIFDADFRPPKHFLASIIPHFNDQEIGLVQARWGHINHRQNFLTTIQSYLLDMHFEVEQQGRHNAGYFINFCGTAGVWRKQCISDAGRWDGTVLSEDLDLSYRAQLKGWKMVFDKNIEVPALLPDNVPAFKVQQFRWTKGIAQTACKLLKDVWRLPASFSKKLHGSFHLLGSLTFVCLFINAVLSVPLLILRNTYSEFILLTNLTAIGAINLLILAYLYYKSSTEQLNKAARFTTNYPLFLVVYLALSVQNSIAVLQGLAGMKSAFIRTPKNASNSSNKNYVAKTNNWIMLMEALLLVYFLTAIGLSFYFGDYFLLLFFMLMSCGLSILLFQPNLSSVKKAQVSRSGLSLSYKTA
jgi:cellulose synthase/poly-beta-1,6-N-acetylglucosamine synthase-like glycosyltransferase